LTEHSDVITPLLRGAPRLDLGLGPAPARAGPDYYLILFVNYAYTRDKSLSYTINGARKHNHLSLPILLRVSNNYALY